MAAVSGNFFSAYCSPLCADETQLIQFCTHGAAAWHIGFGVPLLLDQLAADRGGTQPAVEALCLIARIKLTLGFDDLPVVLLLMRPVFFGSFPAPAGGVVDTRKTTFQFMQPFTERALIPIRRVADRHAQAFSRCAP